MRKKYLSALLFGALLFASAGTFTSCKDYDDDIANLQTQVDKVVSDIKALQDAAGQYVTAVKYDAATGKLSVTGGNGETFQLAMPVDVPEYTLEVADGKVLLKKDGVTVSEGTLPEVPEVSVPDAFDPELLAWGNDGYLYYGTTKIEGVQKPILNASITDIEENGEVIGYIIAIGDDTAKFYVKSELKALVFIPDLYLDGIEGTRYRYLDGQYIEPTGSATGTYTNNGSTTKFEIKAKNQYTVPAVPESYVIGRTETVSYQMNPCNADVENAGFSFEYLASEVISRGDGAVGLEYVDHRTENGNLLIDYKVEKPNLLETDKSKVSVMSLNAELAKKEATDDVTTVNSDYSAIVPSVVTLKNLAFVTGTCPTNHLYVKGSDAASNIPQVYVQYNGGSIDLSDRLNVHFVQKDFEAETSSSATHKTMSYEDVEKYGLHFEYEKLEYTTGNHNTEEDKYGKVTNDGIFTPQYVDENGNSQACGVGTEVGISAVGREPIVIVKLCDANNNVLLAGYIKIHISKKVDNNPIYVKDFGTVGYLCSGIKEEISWDDMSGKIIEKLKMSKEEFFDAYEIEGNPTGTGDAIIANTYLSNADMSEFTLVNNNIYGDLILNLDGVTNPSVTNDIFKWDSDFDEMKRVYALDGHSQILWAKFVSKSDPQDIVYLGFEATVADRPTVQYGDKIAGVWYGTAKDTVRMNVPAPNGTDLDLTQYIKSLDEYFTDNEVKVTYKDGNGVYPTDIAELDPEYEYLFVDTKCGKEGEINLTASQDGKILYWGTNVIAKINGNSIDYAENSFAKELLNKYAHDLPYFYANVKIVSDYCDLSTTVGHSNRIDFIGEETFKVRFQRPVDIENNEDAKLVDGKANGDKVAAYKFIKLIDWRNQSIIDDYGNAVIENSINLFDFYGFTAIKFDLDKAEQNLSKGGDTFESISKTPKLKFEVRTDKNVKVSNNTITIASVDDLKNNYLYYENNLGNVQDFKLRIPVELTYSCGTVKVIVECTVSGTIAND